MTSDRKQLLGAATFPGHTRSVSRDRVIPKRSELRDYNYAVAGHAGTLCDADGELFIKPCTAEEIAFYESARAAHPKFAEWMPLFVGSLSLTENTTEEMIHAAIPGIVEHADIPEPIRHELQSHLHLDQRIQLPELPVLPPSPPKQPEVPMLQRSKTDSAAWMPSTKSRKIKTDRAIVLENSGYGFKRPNIMDTKLGVRLWANDAPEAKRTRFDNITAATTHQNYGFRVAGMRVYKGSEDTEDLDKEDYRKYDKDWGRVTVQDENLYESMRLFIFNPAAGIDEDLGKVVAGVFATDLKKVQEVLEAEESRMFSASLLFVFEGDGEALRAAIEETSASARASVADKANESSGRANPRVDSGIGMDDAGEITNGEAQEVYSDASDESDDFSSMPKIYSLKLIDFAHADWTPGQGPDENILLGVRSLVKLFDDMSR